MRGKEQIEVSELRAGDIGVLSKLNLTGTGDTLTTKGFNIKYPGVEFAPSLMCMAIRPKNKGDEDKISSGMARLCEEDPTISYAFNTETGEYVLSAMGEVSCNNINFILLNKKRQIDKKHNKETKIIDIILII